MGKLKLTNRDSIVQFIENSIDNQEVFFLWVSDDNLKRGQQTGFHSIKFKKILPNNSIKIVLLNSALSEVEKLVSIKNINLKHTETGLFFRTILKKASDGSLSIPIPKLLNFTNTRDKTRNEIAAEHRIKFTGTKKTSYEEMFKFTGNILDFHFHGMAVHLNNQYISQISVGDFIEITKVHTENLKKPVMAEIRYITKEKIIINDVKQIFYKAGLYIKEKLPAETIFALTKYINKSAS